MKLHLYNRFHRIIVSLQHEVVTFTRFLQKKSCVKLCYTHFKHSGWLCQKWLQKLIYLCRNFLYKKIGPLPASFCLFLSYNTSDSKYNLPMTWFEPQISGVGSDHSTYWAKPEAWAVTFISKSLELNSFELLLGQFTTSKRPTTFELCGNKSGKEGF